MFGFSMIDIVVVIIVIAYIVSVFWFTGIVDYFLGWRSADTFLKFWASPIFGIVFISKGAWKILTLPWRYRTRRLFRERFELTLEGAYTLNWSVWNDSPQRRINRLLSHLAENMEVAFAEQEQARSSADHASQMMCDEEVEKAKGLFWKAHDFFRRENFLVRDSFRDYLLRAS